MARNRWTNLALVALLCVAVTVFGMTTHRILDRQSEYAEARTEYADLRELVGVTVNPSPYAGPEGIDWNALRTINPGVVGWIVVRGTEISYPIVQGADNAHYLHHTFSGGRNASGAVFLDYRDCPSFTGRARVYGHNMRDGSMFAQLHGWSGDSIIIHTPNGVLEFPVTGRGAVALSDVGAHEGLTLVTCINGRPSVRLVVRG